MFGKEWVWRWTGGGVKVLIFNCALLHEYEFMSVFLKVMIRLRRAVLAYKSHLSCSKMS